MKKTITNNLIYDSPVEIMISLSDYRKMSYDFRKECRVVEKQGKILRIHCNVVKKNTIVLK